MNRFQLQSHCIKNVKNDDLVQIIAKVSMVTLKNIANIALEIWPSFMSSMGEFRYNSGWIKSSNVINSSLWNACCVTRGQNQPKSVSWSLIQISVIDSSELSQKMIEIDAPPSNRPSKLSNEYKTRSAFRKSVDKTSLDFQCQGLCNVSSLRTDLKFEC